MAISHLLTFPFVVPSGCLAKTSGMPRMNRWLNINRPEVPEQSGHSLNKGNATNEGSGGLRGAGMTASERIVGGITTDPKSFRYHARLTYMNEGTLSYSCGGVLISDRFVLTSAQCVWNMTFRGPNPGGLRSDFVGAAVGLTCDEEDNCGQPSVSFEATNVWVHPNWNPERLSMDMALVRLPAPVSSAVAVPAEPDLGSYYNSLTFGYDNGLISVGYGLTSDSQSAEALQELDVAFMPLSNCESYWGSFLVNGFMCIFTNDSEEGLFGRGLCGGDSGSPTVISREDGTDVVVGLTSFGSFPCSQKTRPDVLARVSAGITYIANVVCYPGMSDYAPEWCSSLGWSSGSQPVEPGASLPGLPEPTVVVVVDSDNDEESAEEAQDPNDSTSANDRDVPQTCEGADMSRYYPNLSKMTKTKKCRKLRQKQSMKKIRKACLRSTSDALTKCCATCKMATST